MNNFLQYQKNVLQNTNLRLIESWGNFLLTITNNKKIIINVILLKQFFSSYNIYVFTYKVFLNQFLNF